MCTTQAYFYVKKLFSKMCFITLSTISNAREPHIRRNKTILYWSLSFLSLYVGYTGKCSKSVRDISPRFHRYLGEEVSCPSLGVTLHPQTPIPQVKNPLRRIREFFLGAEYYCGCACTALMYVYRLYRA